MTEEWRDIPGWEGLYQASGEGRVRSLPRVTVMRNRWGPMSRTVQGKILKPGCDQNGYERVLLALGRRKEVRQVSRLVCEAFHGPPPFSAAVVAHGDGNNKNNRPANLRWTTQKDNIADMVVHGTVRQGTDIHHLVKLTEPKVLAIRARFRPGLSNVLAKEFGVTDACILSVVKRKTWKHI